jgi:hypothetical protein
MPNSSKGNTYKLVNPYVKGEFKKTIKAKNSIEAGKEFYKNLSEHFNNSIPKFYFSIQKGGSSKSKYYHFEVQEKRKKSEVSYKLRPYNVPGNDEIESFVENFNKFKGRFNQQYGGADPKRRKSRRGSKSKTRSKTRSKPRSKADDLYDIDYDYDDLDYREDYSYIPTVSQPFYYMYYDPSVYKLDSFFIPTFYAYATPIWEINTNGLVIYP